MTTLASPWLSLDQFSQACNTLPLVSLGQAARDESVHPYVRVYAQWLRDNARLCD
ncbi:MAG: hypothetical protein RLZZ555_1372 [Pseudomonadota bacterium]|jgi:hypothetical protein